MAAVWCNQSDTGQSYPAGYFGDFDQTGKTGALHTDPNDICAADVYVGCAYPVTTVLRGSQLCAGRIGLRSAGSEHFCNLRSVLGDNEVPQSLSWYVGSDPWRIA